MDTKTIKTLKTIIKHCIIIEETKELFGNNYESFKENTIYQNAVLTPITQIGELVKSLPDEFRIEYKEIPWKDIAGMRDIVVHNYGNIDKEILWDVVDKEIDVVKKFCKKIIKKEGD